MSPDVTQCRSKLVHPTFNSNPSLFSIRDANAIQYIASARLTHFITIQIDGPPIQLIILEMHNFHCATNQFIGHVIHKVTEQFQ